MKRFLFLPTYPKIIFISLHFYENHCLTITPPASTTSSGSASYASFDPEISNTAMGNALNNPKISFESCRMGPGMVYRLVEK